MTKLALSNISDFVGRELGVSGWMTVDQSRFNQFAKCTGDHQSIHVLQIAKPFLEALTNTSAIIFDVPGISGSPLPPLPIGRQL